MDSTSEDHQRAYASLKTAYELTGQWAEKVAARLGSGAYVKLRRKPTNQAGNFSPYNWAKIYPSKNAPTNLAYTVGINASQRFIVKIDTVGDHPQKQAYDAIRGGDDAASGIVAHLSKPEGLRMSMEELVDWSMKKIEVFHPSYDEIVRNLGLAALTNEQILSHFDGKAAFREYRSKWTAEETTRFCRLARLAHDHGLDWWHITRGIQVRFGWKEPNTERANAVLGTVQGKNRRTISIRRSFNGIEDYRRRPLTEELLSELEEALSETSLIAEGLLPTTANRTGRWPDELQADRDVVADDDKDASDSDLNSRGPLNRIYYGPPGTGKTYTVSRLLKEDYELAADSNSNEEWRDQFILEQIGRMSWWEAAAAALYDLGGKGSVSQILEHPFVQAVSAMKGRSKNVRQTLYTTILEKATSGIGHGDIRIFSKIGTGAFELAGDWEVVCAHLVEFVKRSRQKPAGGTVLRRHSFVTFHQSFGYEEFVEGLRPLLSDEDDGAVRYHIKNGVFKDLCERARQSPDHRFAIVIDEINRGNISKIFGELITLIERDKREGMPNEVSVVLPYSGDVFTVPKNIDIIGTMNTADRSLALMDTALRRRFEFVSLPPDTRKDEGYPLAGTDIIFGEQTIDVARMLETINRRIELLYDRDHCIGHAYLTSLAAMADPQERLVALAGIFQSKIIPLLEEYFFDDWRKIRLVLGDNQKQHTEHHFIIEHSQNEELVTELFGDTHEMDSLLSRPRYEVQKTAFTEVSAYLGIYLTAG
ncbi:McrB family protein [Pararhizobium sp.]|uniref:McrB family protein n=1 Tax=Pararhizobium sp. TaxID=1977563 RepID=UPI003D14B944